MKMTLLLCALLLSIHGWCSSGPTHHIARTVYSEDHAGNMKMVLVIWGSIFYLISLLWWTHSTKRSLDKTLDDVLQSMAQY